MRIRQHFLAIFLLLTAFMPLSATILFHDNFQRSDGDVGYGWTEIGSDAAAIDDGEMLITAAGGSGVYRDFPALTDGAVSVQYDWKVESLSGSFLIYPLEPAPICSSLPPATSTTTSAATSSRLCSSAASCLTSGTPSAWISTSTPTHSASGWTIRPSWKT